MSEKYYAIYDTASGVITKTLNGDLTIDATLVSRNTEASESSYESDTEINPAVKYLPGGVITDRPALTSVISWNKTVFDADHTDYAEVTGLPNPCEVFIASKNEVMTPVKVVTDGTLRLYCSVAGSYRVEIKAPPQYLPYAQELTAE